MKNIYIATSGEIKHKAQELCTLLEKYGFNITFKWWLSYTQNGNNEYHQMSPKQFKEIDKIQLIGEIDLMAIEKSDWLILINDKNITPRGSFIEAGYALEKANESFVLVIFLNQQWFLDCYILRISMILFLH